MGLGKETRVDQECVEAYLFSGHPARFLIFRRTPERGQIWVPISGKVDPSDADLPSALRRELAEETGLTSPQRVFSLDWQFRFEGPKGGVWRLHAYGVELSGEVEPTLSSEHEAFEWVDAAEAIRRLHYEDNREAVRRILLHLGEVPPVSGASPNV